MKELRLRCKSWLLSLLVGREKVLVLVLVPAVQDAAVVVEVGCVYVQVLDDWSE